MPILKHIATGFNAQQALDNMRVLGSVIKKRECGAPRCSKKSLSAQEAKGNDILELSKMRREL